GRFERDIPWRHEYRRSRVQDVDEERLGGRVAREIYGGGHDLSDAKRECAARRRAQHYRYSAIFVVCRTSREADGGAIRPCGLLRHVIGNRNRRGCTIREQDKAVGRDAEGAGLWPLADHCQPDGVVTGRVESHGAEILLRKCSGAGTELIE